MSLIYTLKDVVFSGFRLLIPISIIYACFVYIISRDSKEAQIQHEMMNKVIPEAPILEEPILDELILDELILEPIVPKDYSHLKYARKPLHKKFKNKSETIKLKHKNRYDKRLNFRGILW